MSARLAVGIDPDSSYPAQVLSQLGIASVAVEDPRQAVADGVRVFFCDRPACGDEARALPAGQRVAVITHHAALCGAKQPPPGAIRSYRFELCPPSPFAARSFFVNLPVAPAEGESFGACHDRRGREIPNSGIAIAETPGRLVVSLPWNVFAYRQGEQWEHRPYYAPAVGKHFVEVGPPLDTGAFRRLLLEMLSYCFDWAGLPLVRLSPGFRNGSCFSFRIDADGFSESSTQAALRVAEKTGLRFAWFLDMARWKGHGDWIARLKERGHDVQLHCYRHMTYASKEVNRINLTRGLAELEGNGVTASAVVSPLGYNYAGFAEVVRELGFAYSSEFGYAVDDLPSHPGNDRAGPLQIPIHPGCSGVFRHAGFTREEQFRHLRDQVERGCRSDGISILYDHPVGGIEKHEAEYVRLFTDLKQNSCEYMGFSDVHRAWLARPEVPPLWYEEGRVEGDSLADNGFRLEQVTTGSAAAARWKGAELPQVRPAAGSDQFPHPPESIQGLAVRNGRLNLRQRNFTPWKWRLNEFYLGLLDKAGYYRCRQALAQVEWLRSWARSMKRRKPPAQG